jgi:16S rRNA (cytidine1402-2'-O)-methyltransferase
MAGTLFLVATPIGNLDDITLRAIEVLKSVDLIASEDTRHSGLLLARLGISKPQQSYHDHNKEHKTPFLLKELDAGKNIALITDAGTPGVADPAFYLVRAALEKNISIVPIPGPCAAIAALIASGLPTDRFVFENFPPVKSGKRLALLTSLLNETRTVILYESPYRIVRLLNDMHTVFGNIPVVAGRELTKKFEEFLRMPVLDMVHHFETHPPKGEFVVIFNLKYDARKPEKETTDLSC